MEPSVKVEDVVESNVFAAPWKNSDVILVAGGVEFHVHRAILCIHSPVFEAMLNGGFKEAKQDKITLEEKDPSEMTVFLKLMYRSKFIDSPLDEGNVTNVLALADEYQADSILEQCFADVSVTPENALEIVPYAAKYDHSVYEKCIEVAQKEIGCENLKQSMSKLEPNVREGILVGKCELLENALLSARDNLIACLNKLSEDKGTNQAVCCFSHRIKVHELSKTKQCRACLVAYRATFCDCVPTIQKQPAPCSQEITFPSNLTRQWPRYSKAGKNSQLVLLLQEIDDLLSQRSY